MSNITISTVLVIFSVALVVSKAMAQVEDPFYVEAVDSQPSFTTRLFGITIYCQPSC